MATTKCKCAADYKSSIKPTWCQDCGDYNVLDSLLGSFAELNMDPHNTILVAGVGCASRLPFHVKTYGLHTIHGRALPAAIGVNAASPGKDVIVVGGDGDAFSIGGNHFIHASRKNPNITYIVMDNEIYGMTKGQNSPTSHGLTTKINPYEPIEDRINPVLMALSFNASFIARGFSDDKEQLQELIVKGIQHKGFSFIHVLSPCVQFNLEVTSKTIRERIQQIPDNHDTKDRISGMKLAFDHEHLYMGLFYQIDKPVLEDRLTHIKQVAAENAGKPDYSVKDIMKQFE